MKEIIIVRPWQKVALLLLSLCLLFALPLSLSAESSEAQSSNVSATVIAINSPSYNVEIPQLVGGETLYRTSGSSIYTEEFQFTVSDVSFLNGRSLCIRLYSEDGEFHLYNSEAQATLPFLVYGPLDEDTPLENGDVFAYYSEGDETATYTGYIAIDRKDITADGAYEGTVNFSISIIDPQSPAEES